MLLYFHIYIYNIKHDTILLCFIQPIRRIRCMLILAGCAAKESELVSNGHPLVIKRGNGKFTTKCDDFPKKNPSRSRVVHVVRGYPDPFTSKIPLRVDNIEITSISSGVGLLIYSCDLPYITGVLH